MPPKSNTPKEKPIKGAEAEEIVLQYLRSVNRPYASTDVSANLKGRVTKPEAQRALTALADKGRLTLKTNGKQTIFVYNQTQHIVLDSSELDDFDSKIKAASQYLEEQKQELKRLIQQQTDMESSPPTHELQSQISRIVVKNKSSRDSLSASDGLDAAPVSRDETDKIDESWLKWRKEWTSRRGVYRQLIGMLEDGGMDRAQVEDDKGIEQDDDEARELEGSELCKPAEHKTKQHARTGSSRSAGTQVLGKRSRGSGVSIASATVSASCKSPD